MSEQIAKWCNDICRNEDEMHLESYKMFKMIRDEAIQLSQQIQHLTQQLAAAHRAGWEQAKKQVEGIVNFYKPEDVGEAISVMEYKEPKNV